MKKLRVTVNGKVYDCVVEVLEDDEQHYPGATLDRDPSSGAPRAPVRSAPAPVTPHLPIGPNGVPIKGDPDAILAPIAGTVQKIFVKVGEKVEAKAPVVMLDAMKMDTYIYASRTGVIAEVHLAVGDTVQVGDPIVRYKPEA